MAQLKRMTDEEHIIQECICLKCFYRWIDVRPAGLHLRDVYCPSCNLVWYVVGTGEPISQEEIDQS